MGQRQTKHYNKTSNDAKTESTMTPAASTLPQQQQQQQQQHETNRSDTNFQEYQLKKRRPGCTGMFWRSDPTGKTTLASNNNWPRDHAMLRGQVVETKGQKWLLVSQIKQPGSSKWKKTPTGAAIPFEYNNHYYLG